jgi:hypothetical protein
MNSIREFYQKYDEIVKYSAYAFAGWFLSWVLFFYHAPFYDSVLRKNQRDIVELRF